MNEAVRVRKDKARRRWGDPGLIALMAILSMVPLLGPDVAPLVDLPGHMGRYHLQAELARSPALQRFYSFEWALIGNLGVDLLIIPLSKLLGLEVAIKLIVVVIPAATVVGFLMVAREAHGRVPASALFAVPLAYNYPFMFGFVNFSLSMALAFLALALWLRLGRTGALGLRAALFAPISFVIWIAHAYGWGTLGILAFAAEIMRQREAGRGRFAAALHGAAACTPLGGPFILMLLWRSGAVGGATGDWFNINSKIHWILMIFRDRWILFDRGSVGLLLFVIVAGWATKSVHSARMLALGAGLLFLVLMLLPRVVFGSAYADMRLAPYMLATSVLAIGPWPSRYARVVLGFALAFVFARTAATTWSLYDQARGMEAELQALNHLPRDARLVSFVGTPCTEPWKLARRDHLPAFALVRRNAFSNEQWTLAGAQLLRVDYPAGGRFVGDPSQLVTDRPCGPDWLTLDQSLQQLPRDAFDYVWLIDPPRYDPRLTRGLLPVWRSGTSVLFRVER